MICTTLGLAACLTGALGLRRAHQIVTQAEEDQTEGLGIGIGLLLGILIHGGAGLIAAGAALIVKGVL
ncbi:hypothetical protein CKO11_12485 [Rhodobacter sp. TJ_12]|uniref:hypothetical protein n=1 Tax=Rhodobacter sp. TJ_12 TaxID=2029399 RepID=UPI001CBEC628|nr:hypothetical protein [Rhodobacter sp. TJ_12]MBZ4023276.1 hypothetical protein [Rhodobacter sp. TJ_12]